MTFKTYAAKLNDVAQATFTEYMDAERTYQQAEERHKSFSRVEINDYEGQAKAARAKSDYLEAQNNLRAVKRNMDSRIGEVATIRKELAAAIEDAYSADPAALDTGTLELLKSGILKSNEYMKLANNAAQAGNITMLRLIGKYANEQADAVSDQYGQGDAEAKEFRAVAYTCSKYTGQEYLAAFDALTDVFIRCTRNSGLIKMWDELTDPIINQF